MYIANLPEKTQVGITMENEIYQRRMVGDALADSIRARLFAHEFMPGDILNEQALTTHYGVGHLPLVEALQQLVRERLLSRIQTGYAVITHARGDIERILQLLEYLRRFSLVPFEDDTRERVALSVYWGLDGFVVARPFFLATRSLYHQLRIGVGPALSRIETVYADRAYCKTLHQLVDSGATERIESFAAETARDFQHRVLSACAFPLNNECAHIAETAPV